MARKLPPAYCLHRPTGQAYVTGTGGENRKPTYLGKWGTEPSLTRYRDELTGAGYSPTSVELALRIARTGISLPQDPPPSDAASVVTVRTLYDHFLAWAPSHYRLPTGELSREIDSFRHSFREVLTLLGTKLTADVTKRDLEAARQRMVDRRLSRKVINQRCWRVVRVFRWGTEEDRGLVPETVTAILSLLAPLGAYRTAAPERAAVVGVPSEEVERVIAVANPVIAAMLRLQLLTGMRPGEVRGLRKRMVVRREGQWVADFGIEHKMAHRRQSRVVPLATVVMDLLQDWLGQAPTLDSYLFRPEQVRRSRIRGGQFSGTSYGHSVGAFCKKANVPRFAPNQVRHTVGEEVRRSHGLDHVQALLGHKNRQSSERYAPVVQEFAVEAALARGSKKKPPITRPEEGSPSQ